MDFLLDPNVAYLFLLAGVLLGLLAIVTPGTGMLEVGAFFCLALAGYAVYNLSFNWWALGILALSVLPFIYSLQAQKREPFLVLAILALVAGSVFLFAHANGRPAVNPVLAVVASALVTGFLWVAVRKSAQATRLNPVHDLVALVGQTGESKTKIHDEGSVQVAGELWSARSDKPIPSGSPIRVISRDGFILVVERDSSVKSQGNLKEQGD